MICQKKVYERGTFFMKNGTVDKYKMVRIGPRGGASPYKNLLSTPLGFSVNRVYSLLDWKPLKAYEGWQ